MSLRARVLLGVGLVAVVLGLAAVAIARSTERHLIHQVDRQLHDVGRQLPGLDAPGNTEGPDHGGPPRRLSEFFIGRIGSGGELVTLYSPDLYDDAPTPEIDAADVARLRDGDVITVGSADADTRYRVLARLEGPRGAMAVAALPLDDVDDAVRRLTVIEAIAVLSVLGVLGIVTWWVIHLGVRPVRRMTETAGAIAAGDLSQRVPEGTPGTEAGDLGVALNRMLGRIEHAFDERTASEDRLRRFVADASHELRTPVTTIRGYAELYRTGALREQTELDEAMRRTEQEAVRMGSLVDDLLHLARLDQGRPLERAPVDLAEVVNDAARDASAVAPDRSISVTVDGPAVVLGDEARLRQVVANLVGNALVHAPDAAIEVRVATDGDQVRLEVADDGPGMAEPDASRAFERFYRADASRHRHRGGSGLGLSIVEATVLAHGGTVALTSTLAAGTTVTVTLPAHRTPAPTT